MVQVALFYLYSFGYNIFLKMMGKNQFLTHSKGNDHPKREFRDYVLGLVLGLGLDLGLGIGLGIGLGLGVWVRVHRKTGTKS